MFSQINPTNIFLAEDDDEDVDIFKDALSELNLHTNLTVVQNGILLINLLENSETLPDIIFLDLNMPLKNGLQCLKEIKSSEKWKSLNTIILSTSSNKMQKEEMYSHGANFFLTKASTYKEFKNNLAGCIQSPNTV